MATVNLIDAGHLVAKKKIMKATEAEKIISASRSKDVAKMKPMQRSQKERMAKMYGSKEA